MKMGIAVMAKYPASHPRHAVEPDWHPWGGRVFDLKDPTTERKLEQTKEVAERIGCSVRIQRQPFPTDGDMKQ